MLDSPFRYVFIGLSVIITAILLWRSEDSTTVIQDLTENTQEADSFALNTEFVNHNKQGDIAFRLQGAEAKLFLPQNQVIFSLPIAEVNSNSQQHWYFSADQATYSLDNEVVIFNGNVSVKLERKGSPPTFLTSESITLDNKQQTITSATLVALQQGPQKLSAIGLQAWVKEKRLKLLSQVKVDYNPGYTNKPVKPENPTNSEVVR